MHLRRQGLRCGTDGIVQQIGQHDDHVHAIKGDLLEVAQVKIDCHTLLGRFFVLFAQDGVQQRVVGVHDGGARRHRLLTLAM